MAAYCKRVVDLCAVDLHYLLDCSRKQLHLRDLLTHVGWPYCVTLITTPLAKNMDMQDMADSRPWKGGMGQAHGGCVTDQW